MPSKKKRNRNKVDKIGAIKWGSIIILSLLLVFIVGWGYYNRPVNPPLSNTNVAQAPVSSVEDITEFSSDKIYFNILSNGINIYVKNGNEVGDKYIEYQILHLKKALDRNVTSSNYDVWQLSRANEVERDRFDHFTHLNSIVTNGEWEMALKEKGANDFIGGSIHGDEVTTSASIAIDGTDYELGKYAEGEASEVKITTVSSLYRDNTLTKDIEPIGVHSKTYIFKKDGLTLSQQVEFKKNMVLDKSYLTMLPILRKGEGGQQITDTVISDGDSKPQNISEDGFRFKEIKSTKATVSGIESGVTAMVEIVEKVGGSKTSFFVSNSPMYNKLYFSFVGNDYKVKKGEVWSQTTRYVIKTKE